MRSAALALAALSVFLALPGCATVQSAADRVIPGHMTDDAQLKRDTADVWAFYGRKDPPPVVFLVSGADLDCTDPNSGKPGFNCPTVGCREGCTGSPVVVSLAGHAPWSQTVLAHELRHAYRITVALEALLYSPEPAVMILLADHDHKGPDWEPGGIDDQANAWLAERGR